MTAAVFLLGAAVLAHEVCLLRALSLAYWHHAAALVVSVALLGFGVAGSLLAVAPRLKREATVFWCAALYAVLIPLSLRAARAVDFNILEVGWDRSQWLRLAALEAVFMAPFCVAALGIAAALSLRSRHPGKTYAANLLGSGLGALLAPLLLVARAPHEALRIVACTAALGAVVRYRVAGVLAGAAAILLGGQGLEMSPFKDWPATPDKRDIRTEHTPMGRVESAAVASMHFAPGLSMLAANAIPEDQTGLYVDGHLVGARDHEKSGYLARTVGALPFLLLEPRTTLLLGVGPDLARATHVVETNATLLGFSGAAGTAAEPRAFLERTEQRWDLVVHHVPSMHASAETPLLTVEGLRAALSRADKGVAVSCRLAMPPRSGLKLLATAEQVTPHVVAIRSADRLCVILLHAEVAREKVIAFCMKNSFDPVRPVAWRLDDPHNVTDIPLLEPGPGYPYDVRPATDARPYFFKFFKWARLGDALDREATPFVQWPFVALIVAFFQVSLLAVVLLAGPLVFSRAARAPAALFVALGLGFMLLEMAFLQRAMVRLGSPVHAAAAVLGGFLVGSGCGSMAAERLGFPRRRAAIAILVLGPLGWFLLPGSLAAAALVCAVVAFPMGMPFPSSLAGVEENSAPWALAWNGCASVAAASAAPLASSTFGIPATALAALACYAFVAIARTASCEPGSPPR